MKNREIERLEKESTYLMRVNPEIKDQVVSKYLDELCRVVKKEVKHTDVIVFVVKLT